MDPLPFLAMEEKTKKKLALFTNVGVDDVLSCHDAKSIFEVPQILYDQGILDSIFTKFAKVGMVNASANWDEWNKICLLYTSPSPRDGLLSRMPSSA